MAKSDTNDDKPVEVKDAERHGGETFDPTVEPVVAADKCPDCNGEGIRDPLAIQVCQTCAGTGKA